MKDVRDPEEPVLPKAPLELPALSAAQMEKAVESEGKEPSVEEVRESIEALRPESNFVDQAQYETLSKALVEGYSSKQLSTYLTASLEIFSATGGKVHTAPEQTASGPHHLRSPWRPGRTPLERAHPIGKVDHKTEGLTSRKPKLAKKILQLVWNMSICADEQVMGELEIKLKPWELSFLFDVRTSNTEGSVPIYQHYIQSPLLMRTSSVQAHRGHRVVRITARRQDAQDIAERLERSLVAMQRSTLQLDVFKAMLRKPGWPATMEKLFSADELLDIGRRSTTAVEQNQNTLVIHGPSTQSIEHARRLLLLSLDLPSPGQSATVDTSRATRTKGSGKEMSAFLLPEIPGQALQLRHQKLDLRRLTKPTGRQEVSDLNEDKAKASSPDQATPALSRVSSSILNKLASMTSKTQETAGQLESSFWHPAPPSHWEAQICKLLQVADPAARSVDSTTRNKPGPKKRKSDDNHVAKAAVEVPQAAQLSHPTILLSQTPHLPALLSYFQQFPTTPDTKIPTQTHLIAHLIPSPFTTRGIDALSALPRIHLTYRLVETADKQTDVELLGVKATLEETDVRVPLPSDVVDLRMVRRVELVAKDEAAEKNEQIARFTAKLRGSLKASRTGALAGVADVKIKLPAAVAGLDEPKLESGADVDVDYLFERFEQVRSAGFVPKEGADGVVDEQAKETLDGFETGEISMRLKDVMGGVVGGKRMDVLLEQAQGSKGGTERLVETALGIVRMVSSITGGELRARGGK